MLQQRGDRRVAAAGEPWRAAGVFGLLSFVCCGIDVTSKQSLLACGSMLAESPRLGAMCEGLATRLTGASIGLRHV
jgi:hypothetical protein